MAPRPPKTERAVLLPANARNDAEETSNVSPLHQPNPLATDLFPKLGQRGPNPVAIRVTRLEPSALRGEVGLIYKPKLTKEEASEVREKWGGGTYMLEVVDENGKSVPGGKTTLSFPGEPKDHGGPLVGPTYRGIGIESILKDERDFSRRQFEARIEDTKTLLENERLRRKMDLEEAAEKAKQERLEAEERRKADRDEAEAKHKRELEAQKLAHEQRMAEIRENNHRLEQQYARDRERDKEAAQAAAAAQERMLTLVVGTMTSQTTLLVETLKSQGNNGSQMMQALTQGMTIALQLSGGNEQSEMIKQLFGLGEKTIDLVSTRDKVGALERANDLKAKQLASQNPVVQQAGPARANPPAKQAAPAPAEKPAQAAAIEKLERIEKKARGLMEWMAERGFDPEDVLQELEEDLKKQVEEEEGAPAHETPPNERHSDGEKPRDTQGPERGAVAGSSRPNGLPAGRRSHRGSGASSATESDKNSAASGVEPSAVDSEQHPVRA